MAQTFQQIMDTEREPGQHLMATMNSSGDLKTMWNSEKPAEVDAARAQFQSMKARGYMAYRVNRKGDKR
jgi:long-subunit fatty acid transport protein